MNLAQAIVALKAGLASTYAGAAHFYEVIPLEPSDLLPIDEQTLSLLRRFAECNPIYSRFSDISVLGVPCRVYEGDINEY